jgi:hypothetical protein
MRHRDSRLQPRRATVMWAVTGLEHAVAKLGDSRAEQRVRSQFHQLLLALERDGYRFHLMCPPRQTGRLSSSR